MFPNNFNPFEGYLADYVYVSTNLRLLAGHLTNRAWEPSSRFLHIEGACRAPRHVLQGQVRGHGGSPLQP